MFSDLSLTGAFTAAYAVVNQPNLFSQNLIANKSRLGRKKLTIPCLELLVAHMSATFAENAKTCLNKLSARKRYA